MRYEDPVAFSKHDAEAAFHSGNEELILEALLGVSWFCPDWQWVQNHCMIFLESPNIKIKSLAITCLGHLARIHGQIDVEFIHSRLSQMLNDPELGGIAEDALGDIKMFAAGAEGEDEQGSGKASEA